MPQIVNRDCVICKSRITNATNSEFCTSCNQPIHQDCKMANAADPERCAECGATTSSQFSIPMPVNEFAVSEVAVNEVAGNADERDLRAFARSSYYLNRWKPFLNGQRSDLGFNLPAFLFVSFWFAYRKMYLLAVVMLLVMFTVSLTEDHLIMNSLGLPVLPGVIGWLIAVGFWVVCGFIANHVYLKHALRKINHVRSKHLPTSDHFEQLAKAGGTSVSRGVGLCVVMFIAFIGSYSFLQQVIAAPKIVNGAQIYAFDGVTKERVEELGSRLVEIGYLDGTATALTVEKSGSGFKVSLFLEAGTENESETIDFVQSLAQDLSIEVFDRHPVEIHICDENFNTLRVTESID